MSFWGTLAKIGLGVAAPFTGGLSAAAIPAVDAISAGLGGAAQAKAQNRGNQFEGQTELARLMLARDQAYQNQLINKQQADQSATTDAWRKLLSAQHVTAPAAHTNLSPYSVASRMPTGAESAGADALTQQVLARLQGGSTIPTPTPTNLGVDPRLLQAGGGEQTLGWLSALLPALGAFQRPQAKVMSGIPTGAPRA